MSCQDTSAKTPADLQRRGFLAAALGGGVLLAPGITLFEVARADPQAAANEAVRWGMLIDTTKCADGCTDCVSA